MILDSGLLFRATLYKPLAHGYKLHYFLYFVYNYNNKIK